MRTLKDVRANATYARRAGNSSFVEEVVKNFSATQERLSQADSRHDSLLNTTGAAKIGEFHFDSSDLKKPLVLLIICVVLALLVALCIICCYRWRSGGNKRHRLPPPLTGASGANASTSSAASNAMEQGAGGSGAAAAGGCGMTASSSSHHGTAASPGIAATLSGLWASCVGMAARATPTGWGSGGCSEQEDIDALALSGQAGSSYKPPHGGGGGPRKGHGKGLKTMNGGVIFSKRRVPSPKPRAVVAEPSHIYARAVHDHYYGPTASAGAVRSKTPDADHQDGDGE